MRNKTLDLVAGPLVASLTSQFYPVKDIKTYAYAFNYTDLTPAAKAFAAADLTVLTAIIAEVGHGFVTGLKVQVTTSDTLPDGITALTDYFVIVLSANTYSLASSYANAKAGTKITVIDQGVGNHTVTPVALAATVKLEKSIDKVAIFDVAAATAIAATGKLMSKEVDIGYKWVRSVVVVTSGYLGLDVKLSGITEF